MNVTITEEMKVRLEKQIPILRAKIKALYAALDKSYGLHGAEIPITFGMDTDCLGAYTRSSGAMPEHFHFSLLFVGYHAEEVISAADRRDLFLHEYAHYMDAHMEIPKEHTWKPGLHGSSWKYCCSLIGAAPSAYYRFGKGEENHDYEKELRNPWKDPNVTLLDNARREKEYQDTRNRVIRYQQGDKVLHPKFGEGIVNGIEQLSGSVRLEIQFDDKVRKIDQKWLVRSGYQKRA